VAVVEGHDGLCPRHELAPFERASQRSFRALPGLDLTLEVAVEEGHPSAAVLLGPVHGRVGAGEQHVGVFGRLLGPREPHAGRGSDRDAVDLDRLGHRGHESLGERVRLVHVGLPDEHDELVAADPGHGVAGPDGGEDPLRRDGEDPVPDGVAVGVVHVLEVVEVDEHEAVAVPGPPGEVGGARSLVEDGHPVRQAGERVVGGFVRQQLTQAIAAMALADRLHDRPVRLDVVPGHDGADEHHGSREHQPLVPLPEGGEGDGVGADQRDGVRQPEPKRRCERDDAGGERDRHGDHHHHPPDVGAALRLQQERAGTPEQAGDARPQREAPLEPPGVSEVEVEVVPGPPRRDAEPDLGGAHQDAATPGAQRGRAPSNRIAA
jgi:hypothetical protein